MIYRFWHLVGSNIDVTSTIGWFNFINDYFVPKPIVVSKTTLSKEELEILDKKYAGKFFKTKDEVNNELNDFLGLKSSLARLASSSFEINNSRKNSFFYRF